MNKNRLRIFLATGNQDKFKRMSKWIPEGFDMFGPADLEDDLKAATKITDEEEKLAGTRAKRAMAKAAKADAALKAKGFRTFVLALDDTGYFPWIDTEVIDLRTPPEIQIGKKIIPEVTERLVGHKLANYYGDLAGFAATDKAMMGLLIEEGIESSPVERFMPVDWQFSLAGVLPGDSQPKVIAEWEWRQYIFNRKIPSDTPETGYMIRYVASDSPRGDKFNELVKREETVPKRAIKKLLQNRVE